MTKLWVKYGVTTDNKGKVLVIRLLQLECLYRKSTYFSTWYVGDGLSFQAEPTANKNITIIALLKRYAHLLCYSRLHENKGDGAFMKILSTVHTYV